ncbi:hypothetical protein LGM43_04775 [Burkholderia seminalis]|uniref:hypothetical protein n=1 Tax=Burkholderia seminalis TaxID=488731 RepID=UPI001CF2BCC0|nr:hypothetical protein [Burkholderia seminalis]MCA7949577.1 hypothetical protein [Burkholderia seminalis]
MKRIHIPLHFTYGNESYFLAGDGNERRYRAGTESHAFRFTPNRNNPTPDKSHRIRLWRNGTTLNGDWRNESTRRPDWKMASFFFVQRRRTRAAPGAAAAGTRLDRTRRSRDGYARRSTRAPGQTD